MTASAKVPLTVWWILWGSFLMGVVVIYFVLGANRPPGSADGSLVWLAAAGPFVISTLLRWAVLPAARTAEAALPLFIVGIALAEATCLLGLFVFPAHRAELFVLSLIGIAQFAPVFARRFEP